MIQGNQFVYAVPISSPPAKSGETAIYRNPKVAEQLSEGYDDSLRTLQDLFLVSAKNHPQSNFIGHREVSSDGTMASEFTFDTYDEVKELATALGSGMVNLNLTEEKAQFQNFKLKFISIFGKNTREWLITDIANSLYGHTSMPIYDTLGIEAVDHMYNETELSTVFLTSDHIKAVSNRVSGGTIPHLKNLVAMDEKNLTPEIRKSAE